MANLLPMTTTQINSQTQAKKSTKKKQAFPHMDIGTPKVPLRTPNQTKQQHELLSDWDHAS
ncbi:MAG: hypothetical protein AB3A66_05780 [Nodularia sp. CChRGM 3473]